MRMWAKKIRRSVRESVIARRTRKWRMKRLKQGRHDHG